MSRPAGSRLDHARRRLAAWVAEREHPSGEFRREDTELVIRQLEAEVRRLERCR